MEFARDATAPQVERNVPAVRHRAPRPDVARLRSRGTAPGAAPLLGSPGYTQMRVCGCRTAASF